MYICGKKSGYESICEVNNLFSKTGMVPFSKIFGCFTYVIQQKNGDIYMFSDNSNMHCIYLGDLAVSNSYISLLEYYKGCNSPLTLNLEGICEYLTLGNLFFGKTHVSQISIMENSKYILFRNGGCSVKDKGIGDISSASVISEPKKFFDDLAFSLSGNRVCQALTGGYDSRMVYVSLKESLHPQPFFSTNFDDSKELLISKRVSELSGDNLMVIPTEKPVISEAVLKKLVWQYDGIYPLSLDSDFRISNFKQTMQNNGYNVQLTGDGGVLHKDWEWMQDLPFYNKKHTNLQRFYNQRISYGKRVTGLSSTLDKIYDAQKSRFVKAMEPYKKATNTQSYDSLYCYITGNRRIYYNMCTPQYIMYAPLEEIELIKYSYHLQRRKRFFYNNIRRITTAADSNVARIPTNYGTTASSELIYLIRDSFFQGADYFKKACRLVGRKLFNVTAFSASEIDWSLAADLKGLPLTAEAVSFGIEHGLLAENADVKSLSYSLLQRIVHIFILSKEYNFV